MQFLNKLSSKDQDPFLMTLNDNFATLSINSDFEFDKHIKNP